MDINIKGGGLTRTVKCDCPEFPIQLGEKVSDQEVRNLDIKFICGEVPYTTTNTTIVDGSGYGLSVTDVHNTTSNTYLIFYNIPMMYGHPESGIFTDYIVSGAFIIAPYQKIDFVQDRLGIPLLVLNLMGFQTFQGMVFKDVNDSILDGDNVLPYVQVYKLYSDLK